MGDVKTGAMSQRILTNVIGAMVIALLTWSISSTRDRYTATTASHDLAKIRAEITLTEQRLKEMVIRHETDGPHDDVGIRLSVMEDRYKKILEEIRELKILIRNQYNESDQ